jgi:hypothetical protein
MGNCFRKVVPMETVYREIEFDPSELSPIRIPVTPEICPEEGCPIQRCRGNCKVPQGPRAV